MPASASGVISRPSKTKQATPTSLFGRSLFERQPPDRAVGERCSLPREGAAEGEVIHVVAAHLIDLTHLLRQVGERDENARSPNNPRG